MASWNSMIGDTYARRDKQTQDRLASFMGDDPEFVALGDRLLLRLHVNGHTHSQNNPTNLNINPDIEEIPEAHTDPEYDVDFIIYLDKKFLFTLKANEKWTISFDGNAIYYNITDKHIDTHWYKPLDESTIPKPAKWIDHINKFLKNHTDLWMNHEPLTLEHIYAERILESTFG